MKRRSNRTEIFSAARASLLFFILHIFFLSILSAQTLSSYRQKTFAVSDTILLDTLSILPGSIFIQDTAGSIENTITVNYPDAKLMWLPGKKPQSDSIKISYRVLPLLLTKSYFHKDTSGIERSVKGTVNPFSYTVEKQADEMFFTPGLHKQGSISRGISFGNNQDLSVNSNLNLQLSGRLSDNLQVLAAITDDNIPIQPEGNTQQLQEFDQVYIQLYNEKAKLTAGDFQLRNPENYFMKYFKKARGINVSGNGLRVAGYGGRGAGEKDDLTYQPKAGIRNDVQAAAAISRGKFSRNIIQGIEGNQGPYRLTGAENETFVIILSGTERVFMDGQLLLRGQENDYIIDYNTAEITFTAKRLVTKDRRIIVEFQYSDKNYARSLIQFSEQYSSKKVKLGFHIYSEQDSKNQPLQLDLSEALKDTLASIGDSLNNAYFLNIQNTGFSDLEVRYKMVDSLGYDSVFVYSTHLDSAVFRLGFSSVGEGRGNYIVAAAGANGRVFQWMAPDTLNGVLIKKGNFEPLTLIATPKKKQMGTISGEYQVAENTRLMFELAGSNNDLNTFSSKDSKNDQGYALKFKIENKAHLIPPSRRVNNALAAPPPPEGGNGNALAVDSTKNTPLSFGEGPGVRFISSVGYELVNKNFSHIEWFRSPEFDRDWNLRNNTLASTQHIPEFSIGLEKPDFGMVHYVFNAYISEPLPGTNANEFKGIKNSILSTIKTKKFDLNFNGSSLQSQSISGAGDFLRNKTSLAKHFKYLTIGGRNDYEKNLFHNLNRDTLLPASYEFLEWEIFIGNADTAINKYLLSYNQRKDYAVKQNTGSGTSALKEATLGEFLSFSYDILKNENTILRGKSTYRKLTISDSLLTTQKPDNTLLNRIEYSLRLFKGALAFSTFYEVGSGLEVKKEFSFIEVPAGQGVYTWCDYNNNGIKELNEFPEAVFADQARYIKVYTPTSSFVKTYTNQFSQSILLQPAAMWNNKKGFRKIVAKFSDQLAYRVDRKTTRENPETAYNPFTSATADSSLLSLTSSFRNTFYFNRTHPRFGFDINYQDTENKTLLTNGFESRKNIFREISFRWAIAGDYLLNVMSGNGIKSNTHGSSFFSNRNFFIEYSKIQPKFTFQPGAVFRISILFEYLEKHNHAEFGGEKSFNRKIGAEAKINSSGKGSFLANVNFITLDFNGIENSFIAFEMLEGLLRGKNITWSVSWQQTLVNNLQLSLSYNGRSSEHTKVIHNGGIQVRAFF